MCMYIRVYQWTLYTIRYLSSTIYTFIYIHIYIHIYMYIYIYIWLFRNVRFFWLCWSLQPSLCLVGIFLLGNSREKKRRDGRWKKNVRNDAYKVHTYIHTYIHRLDPRIAFFYHTFFFFTFLSFFLCRSFRSCVRAIVSTTCNFPPLVTVDSLDSFPTSRMQFGRKIILNSGSGRRYLWGVFRIGVRVCVCVYSLGKRASGICFGNVRVFPFGSIG